MRLPSLDHLYSDGVALLDLEQHYDIDCMPGTVPRWRAVLADLTRLKAGWRPDDSAIAKAPSLTDWAIVGEMDSGIVQFVGTVAGHPRFPDFRVVRTSIVIALDTRDLRWVRTIGRFYRLLKPEHPWNVTPHH